MNNAKLSISILPNDLLIVIFLTLISWAWINSFPVFEKNFLIEPCKDKQFIEKNCIRKDRVNTIQIEQFIDDAEWWFKKYCDLIKIFQEKLNWYNELIIIKHPTETGFDEFHKKIISSIN